MTSIFKMHMRRALPAITNSHKRNHKRNHPRHCTSPASSTEAHPARHFPDRQTRYRSTAAACSSQSPNKLVNLVDYDWAIAEEAPLAYLICQSGKVPSGAGPPSSWRLAGACLLRRAHRSRNCLTGLWALNSLQEQKPVDQPASPDSHISIVTPPKAPRELDWPCRQRWIPILFRLGVPSPALDGEERSWEERESFASSF